MSMSMSMSMSAPVHVAVACGGTGGHLFPGLAIGRELRALGARVTLLVSEKEVDREAVAGVADLAVRVLPGVGLQGGNHAGFAIAGARALLAARRVFRGDRPDVVLGMGGFTSAAPVIVGRWMGAATAVHEANTVPGRANRWLSRWVDLAMVGFEEAAGRWSSGRAEVTGTPVREVFRALDAGRCREELGLEPGRPVLAVMGGSQGASGLNRAIAAALPALLARWPRLQFVHLCGHRDVGEMQAAHEAAGARSVVEAFSARVEVILGAATVAVARSGASTLAELAAMGVASVLVPFPAAVDDHQRVNAEVFGRAGASRVMAQADATPGRLLEVLGGMLDDEAVRRAHGAAARALHRPGAARRIAERLQGLAGVRGGACRRVDVPGVAGAAGGIP